MRERRSSGVEGERGGGERGEMIMDMTIDPRRTAVLVLHMMNEQLHYKEGVTGYSPEFAESNKEWHIIENEARSRRQQKERNSGHLCPHVL
jgi:hypothetical protein